MFFFIDIIDAPLGINKKKPHDRMAHSEQTAHNKSQFGVLCAHNFIMLIELSHQPI